MRLDSANRSFLAFVGLGLLLGAYGLCGAVGGVLGPLILARASREGVDGLAGGSMLPALLFTLPVAVGLALMARSLTRQILASHRLAQRVRVLASPSSEDLIAAAMRAGLGGRVVLVDASESFSFVYGMLSPRVVVSRGLLRCASADELRAVLEHERYHVRNLDPLKAVLMKALSAGLFFLPALDCLRVRYVAGRELAADRQAVAACGRRPLVGALLKVMDGPRWSELHVASSIGGCELLHVRLTQLETGTEPKPGAFSVTRGMISFLGVVLLTATFLAAVWEFGGPAAVHRVTGAGLASSTLLGSLSCTAPFAVASLLAYLLAAARARRPLQPSSSRMASRS